MSETFLAIECTFAFATRIRIRNKTAIPPISADIIEKMVHYTVAKGSCYDFSNYWVAHDKSHTTTGFIIATHDTVAQVDGIFHGIKFVAMLVYGMTFTLTGSVIGYPEFVEEKSSETSVVVTSHSWW